MKACPVCCEQVEDQESECRWCGESISADAPSSDAGSELKEVSGGTSRNSRVLAAVLAVVVGAIVGAVGVRSGATRSSEETASGGGQQAPGVARCSVLLGVLFAPIASTDTATQAQGQYEANAFLQQYFPADTPPRQEIIRALETVWDAADDERTTEAFRQIRRLCDRRDIVSAIETLSARASIVGRWEFAFPGLGASPPIPATLEVSEDGSWSISFDGAPGPHGAWEVDGDVYELRAVNLHSGELQDSGLIVRRRGDGSFVMIFQGSRFGELPLTPA